MSNITNRLTIGLRLKEAYDYVELISKTIMVVLVCVKQKQK